MAKSKRLPAMSFAALERISMDRQALDSLLEAPSFRAVANLLTDAVIVIDLDGSVAFINLAAEKISGTTFDNVEKRSFESFLRKSGLDMDEWLASSKSRNNELINQRSTGMLFSAYRRIITLVDESRGYELITLRPPLTSGLSKASGADQSAPSLFFPESLEKNITHAICAYQRKARVLLLGESGVGKTAIARHIHNQAANDEAPFVHVNCGSVAETLFESEMFGYERGAFTGALQAGKKGFIETSRGGTLFLDEIGEIPMGNQAKLLKFLEDGTIQPVGSALSRKIETTVIAATNRDLRAMVKAGEFRRDLFYRIATFPITVPPLREREDRGKLFDVFLAQINENREPVLTLSKACREKVLLLPLTGNMREIRGIIEYLDIVVEDIVESEHLDAALSSAVLEENSGTESNNQMIDYEGGLKDQVQLFEKQVIDKAVSQFGSKRAAARKLGIDVSTLIRKQERTTE